MTELGKRLIQAAHEAVAIARGEADPSTFRVHDPAAIDIKTIRDGLGLSLAEFAERFRFSLDALREFEQGKTRLDSSTQAYLTVISREPDIVRRALESV